MNGHESTRAAAPGADTGRAPRTTAGQAPCAPATPRARYEPPRLEALGRFQALTLQQSFGFGPGDF